VKRGDGVQRQPAQRCTGDGQGEIEGIRQLFLVEQAENPGAAKSDHDQRNQDDDEPTFILDIGALLQGLGVRAPQQQRAGRQIGNEESIPCGRHPDGADGGAVGSEYHKADRYRGVEPPMMAPMGTGDGNRAG
jgi:hypothetical protein